MPNSECTVCALDAKPRKLVESLLRAGVGVRDAADFVTWQGEKAEPKYKVSKSALDRHRVNGHFQVGETVDISNMGEDEVKSLRDYARDLFKAYQKANKGKVPSTKELIDFLLADAKLADIENRRRDEESIRALMSGAAFKKPEEPEAAQSEAEPSSST